MSRKLKFLIFIIVLSLFSKYEAEGQDCSILSKANIIIPDKLCSPLSVTWKVNYSGVNNAGSAVQVRYDWDDGAIDIVNATTTGAGLYETSTAHTYISTGDKCNYRPKATLIVNGVQCTSSTQEQIVTVWDDDNHNGGRMHIDPEVYPVCFGNSANVRFRDLTRFNCVPPLENDIPNLYTRWVQWIYGTANTMTGIPVTINGTGQPYPFNGSVITLPGPVTGSGVYSDIINVAADKQIGQYFQVTLRNWNYCNPYDDPDIPGPPADIINGDHPPVVTTAIILIVPDPDATITPVDTLCSGNAPVALKADDAGGKWSGDGVINGKFDPWRAGPGNHTVSYTLTDPNGCSDSDKIVITVLPSPVVKIDPVQPLYINDPPVKLVASIAGGTWQGKGMSGDLFNPAVAGAGTHKIIYTTDPDSRGCYASDTININVLMPPLPVSGFMPDTSGCAPLLVKFRNLSTNSVSFKWDFGDNSSSSETDPVHVYSTPGEYIVTLTATNISGSDNHHASVSVFPVPEAIFTIFPVDVINNNQVVVFTNYSTDAVSYLWNFGDGSRSDEFGPWHKYDTEGTYNVSLVVTSKDGCKDSSTFRSPVVVKYKTGTLRFANAFRWNRSGPTGGYWEEGVPDDEIFRPFADNVIEYHLQIFNRWGVLLFESTELQKGWDGYFDKTKLALEGVYVYKVTGRYADGKYFTITGNVTFLH